MTVLTKRTLLEHAAALRRREYSSVELTRAYIEKIEETDKKTGAFLYFDPESALGAAKEADKRLRYGDTSPLCGIPMAIKDNICTASMPTTCASKMLEGYVPPYDATVVEVLEKCGCVMLGKTNMDEFAMGSGSDKSAFFKVHNPLDINHSPGGSSGGSAAAVAGGEAAFCLGSDTGGSVRQPSAFCGVVGMKPTYGAVSRSGLVSFAPSFDQIGPITRDVADNAAVLAAISGADRKDAVCTGLDGELASGIDGGVEGVKIGIVAELTEGADSGVLAAVRSAAAAFASAGAGVEAVSLPALKYAMSAYHIIASAEASSNLARFDGVRYGHRTKSRLSDTDDMYIKSRSEGFGYEVKLRIMLGIYVLSREGKSYYEKAQAARGLIRGALRDAFSRYDFLISPMTHTTSPLIDAYKNDTLGMYKSDVCGLCASLAGIPAISVPCGTGENGMPVGLQIMGRRFSEKSLYRTAYALERELVR